MYAAILNQKLVTAVGEAAEIYRQEKVLNGVDYRCPHCHKRVILVISQHKLPFFKHFRHHVSLGEKEEHHLSKMMLKSAFTAIGFDAQVEVPLLDGQLRSDVLVSPKLALEVQCAPLSRSEFIHRHNLYRQIGITDLWIVGKRHYLQKQLKSTQLIFFRENIRWRHYYLEVDPNLGIIRLKYNVCQAPISRKLKYQIRSFPLDERGVAEFWSYRPQLRSLNFDRESERKYLERQIKQKSNIGARLAEKLYLARLSIDDLPEVIFSKSRHPGEKDNLSRYLEQRKTSH